MDGLALATVFSVNAKKILSECNYPILLVRSTPKPPLSKSIFDTPDSHILHQDTNPTSEDVPYDYYLDPETVVLPLFKSNRNTRSEITFGRAKTNDICLADPTLSKVQGWFVPPKKTEETWYFVDNASTNGTIINRHKILPHRNTVLHYGDELVAGDVQVLFLSKESVFDLIHYLESEDQKTKRLSRSDLSHSN